MVVWDGISRCLRNAAFLVLAVMRSGGIGTFGTPCKRSRTWKWSKASGDRVTVVGENPQMRCLFNG